MPEPTPEKDNVVTMITEDRARNLMMGAARKFVIPYSINPGVTESIKGLFKQYAPLGYQLPWQILDYIELLSTFNPDYSQAVDNIRTLANSGHTLYVTGKSKRATKEAKGRIEEKARTIQASHGGIDGVIDKLLDQAATYGAMCGEWILSEDLKDVVDFADINPKYIRFFWDELTQKWAPYQKVHALQAKEAEKKGMKVLNGQYVQLNPMTFHYYAFNAEPGNPYGVPPFLAALAPIAIQRDMVENLSQVVKKLGLLAVIDMNVKAINPLPGESEDAYQLRAGAYLQEYVNVVEDMAKDGGIIHFDDVELNVTQLTGNAAGATNIFKQNEEQVFSGLKSMPSVQGRSYSTTETYAGVAYDIIIRNTNKYQRAVKRMIENGYWLMSLVWGLPIESTRIEFNDNKTLHRLQNAQAEKVEIENSYRKWRMGIFDQILTGQELGYSDVQTPYSDAPPIYDDQIGGGAPDTSPAIPPGGSGN